MRSHRGGDLSATTQVKILSPKITRNALGQGFHIPETNIDAIGKGETATACRGLSPWRVNEMFLMELRSDKSYREEAFKELKK